MGAACCVAAKDRSIVSVPRGETLQRHVRTSPSWSFRWDNNRGRVAVEETTFEPWVHGGNEGVEFKSGNTPETAFASEEGSPLDSGNEGVEFKSRTVFASEEGSPLDSFRSLQWKKSPEGNADQAISSNVLEVKESTDYPSVSNPSPRKHSSVSSSQSHMLPRKLNSSKWNCRSPRRNHFIVGQSSGTRIPDYKKSPTLPISEQSSTMGSGSGSYEMPIPFFSDLTLDSRERTWSFDSESSNFSGNENIPTNWNSIDLNTCGVCSKLLTERSSWAQKMISFSSANELAVISVLTCGHVYHAECLEHMTPEINKYDPPCPTCTFSEKQAAKMSEKALKAEMDVKAARKRSRKRVVDRDIGFENHPKCSEAEGSGLKLGSSEGKNLHGKPFLKRHFSFSPKASRVLSGNSSARRKSFFWARSSSKN